MVTARGTGLPSGLPRDTVANNSAIVASDSCILSISLRYMVDGIQEGKSGIRDGMAHRVRPAGPGRRENLEFVPAFYVRLNSAIASSKWRSCRLCSARCVQARAMSRHVTKKKRKNEGWFATSVRLVVAVPSQFPAAESSQASSTGNMAVTTVAFVRSSVSQASWRVGG